jgi:hypothetical protein
MRRIVRVSLHSDLLAQMVIKGWAVGRPERLECVEGLPDGSKLVSSAYDVLRACCVLYFEHESFAPVPHGVEIPEVSVQYRKDF